MSRAIDRKYDKIIYKKVKMMPEELQKEVLDFVEYLIQKRIKIVKDVFEATEKTKKILEAQGYTEENISDFVKEVRNNDDLLLVKEAEEALKEGEFVSFEDVLKEIGISKKRPTK